MRSRAHVPLIDRRHQTGGMLTQDAFVYDEASDTYTCPQGAVLNRYSSEEDVQRYRASQRDCGACPIKASCTTAKMRALCRSPHEEVRERVPSPPGHPGRPPVHAVAQGRRAPVRPHQAPRRAAPSPVAGLARRGRAVRARGDGAKPQAHGPVDGPPTVEGRDGGVGTPLGGRLGGTARAEPTRQPADHGHAPSRRCPPNLFQQSRSIADGAVCSSTCRDA